MVTNVRDGLTWLTFVAHGRMSRKALEHVARIPRSLALRISLTGDDLPRLAGAKNVKILRLSTRTSHSSLGDKGLMHLQKMTWLEELQLPPADFGGYSQAALDELRKVLSKTKVVVGACS
jgi:hypothetical protein